MGSFRMLDSLESGCIASHRENPGPDLHLSIMAIFELEKSDLGVEHSVT
jgi:hypothetical protein